MDIKKYFSTDKIRGRYQETVAADTAKALTLFCEQEQEFAQAVEQSGKSFQECLDEITKDIKHSCSDLEVFSRAVKFYFPGAEIHYNMQIDLIGAADKPNSTMTENPTKSALSVSLDELLDF